MIKQNKWKILISSIVILLPMLFGLIMWDRLPEQMAIHWGPAGEADGFGTVALVVFGTPLLLLAVHLLCFFLSSLDKRLAVQEGKAYRVIFFIMPFLSFFVHGLIYATAFGWQTNVGILLSAFLGLMFVVIGNYMPKCKQNFSMGIKVKWALTNEENWYATHRFAGKVYVFGGLFMMLLSFLPMPLSTILTVVAVFPIALSPAVYSYIYARKQIKERKARPEDFKLSLGKKDKKIAVSSAFIGCAVLVGCLILMVTGDVSVTYGKEAFTVDSIYHDALTVSYEDIESVSLLENAPTAYRVIGFGSARLSLGVFENATLDTHTRYTYTGCSSEVVLRVKGDTLVLNGETEEETHLIYETLLAKVGE
ncbi:MAG: SdpI family protein [Clostridia bacterium]|nr:SdpI family protein [Clostridia bacterium]